MTACLTWISDWTSSLVYRRWLPRVRHGLTTSYRRSHARMVWGATPTIAATSRIEKAASGGGSGRR